jgi:ABC-type transport system involved in multi-copper enzyme maturation permease subunit
MLGASLSEWVGLGILAVVAIVLLGVAVWLAVGLFQARSLIRREFTAYFLSPIAYVVLVFFMFIIGYLFSLTLGELTATGPHGVEFPMQFMLGDKWLFWFVFLIIPPLLTMRLFAEERGSGTLEMLMTAPLRDWQLVLSKFVACYAFYVILWLPTLIFVPVLVDAGPPVWQTVITPWSATLMAGVAALFFGAILLFVPGGNDVRGTAVVLLLLGAVATAGGGWAHYTYDDQHIFEMPARIASGPMPIVATYLGLALAGAMLLALGLFVSSLVRNQLVAALAALALGLVFVVTGFVLPYLDSGSTLYRTLFFVSIPQHFSRDFTRGLIDTRHVTLYSTVAVFSLFLTVRSLESRRWRS